MQRAIVKDLGLWTWLIILRWEFEQASAVDSVVRASTSRTPDTYNIVGFYYISVLTHTISTRDSSVSFCAIMGRSGSFCYNSRGKCGKVRILKLHFVRHPGTFLGPLHIFWKHLNIGSNCWPPTASSAGLKSFILPSLFFCSVLFLCSKERSSPNILSESPNINLPFTCNFFWSHFPFPLWFASKRRQSLLQCLRKVLD